MQRRHLHEELRYQDENVQVERNRCRYSVNLAPSPGEMKQVARRNGKGQDDQRNNAQNDPWCHFMEWKEKASNAG